MTSNELIKLITDNNLQEIFCEFGMNYYTLIYFFEYERKVDFETFERLKLNRAESVDSAYNSDELYNVVHFKLMKTFYLRGFLQNPLKLTGDDWDCEYYYLF